MPELFRLCDRISVLRDGQYVGTVEKKEMTPDAVVRMMIGRSVAEYFPTHHSEGTDEVVLSVRNLASPGKFRGVNFEIRRGEIVGFAGLVGAGRSEIAKAIFGLDPRATGEVVLAGKPLPLGSVQTAMRAGVGLVPEDRKRQGCVLGMPCRANISLAMLDRLSKGGPARPAAGKGGHNALFRPVAHQGGVARSAGEFPQRRQPAAGSCWPSGWRAGGRLLIVDEPTRGVDVGAKAGIHALIDELGAARARRDVDFLRITRGHQPVHARAGDARRASGRRIDARGKPARKASCA